MKLLSFVGAATLALAVPGIARGSTCADPLARVTSAEQDVIAYFLADASGFVNEAVAAFGCSSPASAPVVARLFLVHGMIRYLQDDAAGAERAFYSARKIDAEVWNADYGDAPRALWASSDMAAGKAPATVTFKGFGAEDWLTVNGEAASPPLRLPPGLHLVQVGRGGVARFARLLDIQPGAELLVTVQGGEQVEVAAEGVVSVARTPTDEAYQGRRQQYLALKLTLEADLSVAGPAAEWEIRDGHGRSLRGREFAKLVGDTDRYRTLQARYTTGLATAGTLYGVGAVLSLTAAGAAIADAINGSSSPTAGMLGLGSLACFGVGTGVAVHGLGKQAPRFHYERSEALDKMDAYNQTIRQRLEVGDEEARLRVRPSMGVGGVAVRGEF